MGILWDVIGDQTMDALLFDRELRNTNRSLQALADQHVCLNSISDTLNSFEALYHQDAIIFVALCKEKECLNRVWRSMFTKDGHMYPKKFFAGIETKAGPIVRVFIMDDYEFFDFAATLNTAPYNEPIGYTADKIAAL